MQITNEYQAKYIARVLSSARGSGVERLSAILADAKVDLNPHQITAAVFALSNPFSKGLILADEVGLGKTIEAGIIIAQKWAEEKRKIIVVVPSTLKRQWAAELEDKFYLPTQIVDNGELPQKAGAVLIASYNYAYLHEAELRQAEWDMVVFDEAHKLRNVYQGNVMAESIKETFKSTYKLLLTATPLQNSLLELYGLVSIIDENIFGDLESFKNNYTYKDNSKELADRLKSVCVRTLRRQVTEYIKYTDRYSVTQEFTPQDAERLVYGKLTEYVYEKSRVLKGIPKALIGVMLLKSFSSSPDALIATLTKMRTTLADALKGKQSQLDIMLTDDEQDSETATESYRIAINSAADLITEIEQLDTIIAEARLIKEPSKAVALIDALSIGFDKLKAIGAKQKAVIFTESLKTQDFLYGLLKNSYKENEIQVINGSCRNRDENIKAFEANGKILISTEVGGEGLNLQFCSMVINYDLAWNPQRIEQRIGRCHRYGQKHDVAVINFLSKDNYAEQRLYELMSQKFRLFEGVFGASDTILGVLEDMDFEKRIAEIYRSCRTEMEINEAFTALRSELDEQIKESNESTKRLVFDYLDMDVASKLKLTDEEATAALDKTERLLWNFTKYKLSGWASIWEDAPPSFTMHKSAYKRKKLNALNFRMDKNENATQRYRLNCPLASELIFDSIYREAVHSARLTYALSGNPKVSALERLKGKSGLIGLFTIKADGDLFDSDFLLYGMTGNEPMNHELCEKLLMLKARDISRSSGDYDEDGKETSIREIVALDKTDRLLQLFENILPEYAESMQQKMSEYFDSKCTALDKWASDKKQNIERRLKEFDRKITVLKSTAQKERILAKKLAILEEIKKLEKESADKRLKAYADQEKIGQERDELIAEIKTKMHAKYKAKLDFVIEWEIK